MKQVEKRNLEVLQQQAGDVPITIIFNKHRVTVDDGVSKNLYCSLGVALEELMLKFELLYEMKDGEDE